MYDLFVADEIKKFLNLQEKNFKGESIFRLTWADAEIEKREGTYNEFKGELFVRQVYGVKATPKYPHLKGCWIIEQWFPPEKTQTKEIKDHNGYECLYAFRRGFKPLPLRLDAAQFLIKKIHEHRRSQMLTKSLLQSAVDEKERIADQYTYDAIDPSSPIESALHFKEGVSLAGLDIPVREDKNATSTKDV